MVYIYTISDNVLFGKQQPLLANYICENLYKNNIIINSQMVLQQTANLLNYVAESKESDVVLFLVDRGFQNVANYIAEQTKCVVIDNAFAKNHIMQMHKNLSMIVEKTTEQFWQMPQGAKSIINPNGFMQGYMQFANLKNFIVLPNSFEEGKQMFESVVLDNLKNRAKSKIKSFIFKTFGITESALKDVLREEIANKHKVKLFLFAKPLQVDIVLKSNEDNVFLEEIAQRILLKLDKFIYSIEDLETEDVIVNLLKLNNLSLCFAEGTTGGKICCSIHKQQESVVAMGSVLPTNFARQKFANLNEEDLQENNGINATVAYKMAQTAIESANGDVVVSNVANIDKTSGEYGLCFIAVGDKKEIHIYKNVFKGSEAEIKETIKCATYFYLIKKLKRNDLHFEKNEI